MLFYPAQRRDIEKLQFVCCRFSSFKSIVVGQRAGSGFPTLAKDGFAQGSAAIATARPNTTPVNRGNNARVPMALPATRTTPASVATIPLAKQAPTYQPAYLLTFFLTWILGRFAYRFGVQELSGQ